MEYYKLEINHTSRNRPADDMTEDQLFDTTVETFKTKKELENYLVETYNSNILKKQDARSYIYIDTKDGQTKKAGIIKQFWNKDWSHDSKSWWQTDWITIYKVKEEPVYFD